MYSMATWSMHKRITSSKTWRMRKRIKSSMNMTAIENQQFCLPTALPRSDETFSEEVQHDQICSCGFSADRDHMCFEMDLD